MIKSTNHQNLIVFIFWIKFCDKHVRTRMRVCFSNDVCFFRFHCICDKYILLSKWDNKPICLSKRGVNNVEVFFYTNIPMVTYKLPLKIDIRKQIFDLNSDTSDSWGNKYTSILASRPSCQLGLENTPTESL